LFGGEISGVVVGRGETVVVGIDGSEVEGALPGFDAAFKGFIVAVLGSGFGGFGCVGSG
jgi:hypothetical protein